MTKKFDYYFGDKDIVRMIYLHDEEDNERLDHVLFLEEANGGVIGMYIRGLNPLFSMNRVDDLDNFNLYDSYEGLIECKEHVNLTITCMSLYFSKQYNELLGCYLHNSDGTSSILILFLQDELYIQQDCSKADVMSLLEERFSTVGFITYEKNTEEWMGVRGFNY